MVAGHIDFTLTRTWMEGVSDEFLNLVRQGIVIPEEDIRPCIIYYRPHDFMTVDDSLLVISRLVILYRENACI